MHNNLKEKIGEAHETQSKALTLLSSQCQCLSTSMLLLSTSMLLPRTVPSVTDSSTFSQPFIYSFI